MFYISEYPELIKYQHLNQLLDIINNLNMIMNYYYINSTIKVTQ